MDRIPAKVLSVIERENVLGVSAISLWEIAMLADKGRITLSMPLLPWLRDTLSAPKMTLLPITPEIAARSGSLVMHGDPADRLITATALEYDCVLATVDTNLLALPVLKTVA
jgi:PIN domain nuclease of toxin-antitoxin system